MVLSGRRAGVHEPAATGIAIFMTTFQKKQERISCFLLTFLLYSCIFMSLCCWNGGGDESRRSAERVERSGHRFLFRLVYSPVSPHLLSSRFGPARLGFGSQNLTTTIDL